MLSVSDSDKFFLIHPLSGCYGGFSEAEKEAALHIAECDVSAALGVPELPADAPWFTLNAVYEQMIFLLLNPEHLTGRTSGTPLRWNLCHRAYTLLTCYGELSRTNANGSALRLVRG